MYFLFLRIGNRKQFSFYHQCVFLFFYFEKQKTIFKNIYTYILFFKKENCFKN